MNLQIWMENYDLQIVLDEKQAIWYLVKYASKADNYSTDMSEILQYLVPLIQDTEQSEGVAKNEVPVGRQADNISGPNIIRKLYLKSVGIRNKTQQGIFPS